MSNDRIKKVTSSTGSLPPVLLDLTSDTVSQSNLQKDETAHNNEGYPITGQMAIEDAEAWAVGTKNGVPVAETDIQFNNNSKYYANVSGSIMRIAGQQALAAATSANNAHESELAAADNAVISGSYMRIAGEYKDEAAASADRAIDSEAYAVGTRGGTPVSPTDPTYHNNAKYYKDECESIAGSLTSVLKPKGTCLFANLPTIASSQAGDMWNIEDAFTTTSDFREGAGVKYAAGSNVYLTIDNKWDVLSGSNVVGVKGNAETNYRTGGVNITPANIGYFSGSTMSIGGAVPPATAEDANKALMGDGSWGKAGNDELIANTENGNTATHAYTKGQQFIKENKLYKAVKDIAVGDELKPYEDDPSITPVAVGLKLAGNFEEYPIDKIRVYSSGTEYIDYPLTDLYEYDLTVYTGCRVVMYHNSLWGWYYSTDAQVMVEVGTGAACSFVVPTNASGNGKCNIFIDSSGLYHLLDIQSFWATGWTVDIDPDLIVLGDGIGNYVLCGNITDQIQIFKGVNGSIASVSGLVPPSSTGGENKFFRGDGEWADLPIFQGVSGSVQSVSGLLPQAQPGDENKAFFGDGTYKTVETVIDKDLDSSSNHPVENQAIAKNIEAVVNVYGSKNLLNNVAATSVDKSVTFTVNSDGSVTVNGTATGGDAQLNINTAVNLPEGHYIVTGRPQNAAGSYIAIKSGDNWFADIGEGVTVDGAISQIVIVVQNTHNISNLTFYPMIRDARITDPTYVPYAMTNRELTENVIKTIETTVMLSSLSWTNLTLTPAMYYASNVLSISNAKNVISAMIVDFGYLRGTDFIQPYVYGKNLGIMSNTNSFYNSSSQVKIKVAYI